MNSDRIDQVLLERTKLQAENQFLKERVNEQAAQAAALTKHVAEMKEQASASQAQAALLEKELAQKKQASEALAAKIKLAQELLQSKTSVCQFPKPSTPLRDIQIAYCRLTAGTLSSEELGALDQAVEAGDMSPIIDIFSAVANRPEYQANPLIKAIGDRAVANKESPNEYISDVAVSSNQLFLAEGIVWALLDGV
ncbi:hypothetical protein BDR26DRAFT_855847 [Obelidium mucronatum]|nr:hypothetical protein BDR26DRAFT_855847 [Obelidium mucronatum]